MCAPCREALSRPHLHYLHLLICSSRSHINIINISTTSIYETNFLNCSPIYTQFGKHIKLVSVFKNSTQAFRFITIVKCLHLKIKIVMWGRVSWRMAVRWNECESRLDWGNPRYIVQLTTMCEWNFIVIAFCKIGQGHYGPSSQTDLPFCFKTFLVVVKYRHLVANLRQVKARNKLSFKQIFCKADLIIQWVGLIYSLPKWIYGGLEQ